MAKAVFGKTGQRHSITVRVTDVPLVLSSFPARIDSGVKVSWSAPPSAWRLWLLCLHGEKTSWETRAPVLGLLSQGSGGQAGTPLLQKRIPKASQGHIGPQTR